MLRKFAPLAAVVALVGGLVGAVDSVGASGGYPVSYHFLKDAARYGAKASPPGANLWDCTPDAAHPRPVVLVHGTAGSAGGNWASMSASLANAGYCVFALTYGVPSQFANLPVQVGGMNPIESSAAQLATFVDRVRAATGAAKVDIVGHSQGTFMPEYWVKHLGGAQYVDKYVSLSPLWHGELSPIAPLVAAGRTYGFDAKTFIPVCKACAQMTAGSSTVADLRAGGAAVEGIDYTNIVTRYDDVVIPYTSGIESGMRNIVLQSYCAIDFSDHVQIPASRTAIDLVKNALDPAHATKPRCTLTLPANG